MKDSNFPRKWKRYAAFLVLTSLAIAVWWVFVVMPPRVEQGMNRVLVPPPYAVSDAAKAVHDTLFIADLHADTLFIADLHADSLLWSRDLSKRGSWGQVDIPRLREANVGLQVFTAVTKSPEGQNMRSNSAEARDRITGLVIAQRWPARTWFSLCERAIYQAERLERLAARDDDFLIVRDAADLASLVARRTEKRGTLGALLGIEGLHCLEGDLDNIDVLFDAGYRMMAPTHFFDNEIGGSAHGETKEGLSEFGRAAIKRIDELGVIIDLAHASEPLIDDVLALTTRPVLVSHTGVRGTCDHVRNLSDNHLRAIAAGGGIIGIALFDVAVCGDTAQAVARAMKYTADLVGVEHVALGSDFDGAIDAPFDVTGLPVLTEALLAQGFSEGDIAKIMGGNARDFLARALPEGAIRANTPRE
jgi:membrane dipeptidase